MHWQSGQNCQLPGHESESLLILRVSLPGPGRRMPYRVSATVERTIEAAFRYRRFVLFLNLYCSLPPAIVLESSCTIFPVREFRDSPGRIRRAARRARLGALSGAREHGSMQEKLSEIADRVFEKN